MELETTVKVVYEHLAKSKSEEEMLPYSEALKTGVYERKFRGLKKLECDVTKVRSEQF